MSYHKFVKKLADNPTKSKSMMPGEVTDRYYPEHYYGAGHNKGDGRYMIAPWTGNYFVTDYLGDSKQMNPSKHGLDYVEDKYWPSSDPLKIKFNPEDKYPANIFDIQMDPYKQDEHMVPAYNDYFNRKMIGGDYPITTYPDSYSKTNEVYMNNEIPKDISIGHPNDTGQRRIKEYPYNPTSKIQERLVRISKFFREKRK